MIAEATMLNGGWAEEHPEYECEVQMPNNLSNQGEDKILEEKINRVRRILRWREIRL